MHGFVRIEGVLVEHRQSWKSAHIQFVAIAKWSLFACWLLCYQNMLIYIVDGINHEIVYSKRNIIVTLTFMNFFLTHFAFHTRTEWKALMRNEEKLKMKFQPLDCRHFYIKLIFLWHKTFPLNIFQIISLNENISDGEKNTWQWNTVRYPHATHPWYPHTKQWLWVLSKRLRTI